MNSRTQQSLDAQLVDAFQDLPQGSLGNDFAADVVARVGQQQPVRKAVRFPVLILSIYWLVSAVVTVLVLKQIGWVALSWTAASGLAVLLALILVTLPMVVLIRSLRVSFLDLLFQTIQRQR